MVLDESDIESAWDEFHSLGTTNSIEDMDLSRFHEVKMELPKEDELTYDLLWLEVKGTARRAPEASRNPIYLKMEHLEFESPLVFVIEK